MVLLLLIVFTARADFPLRLKPKGAARNTQTRTAAHWPDSIARTRVNRVATNIAEYWPLTFAAVVSQLCLKMMSPDCRLHVFRNGTDGPNVILGVLTLKHLGGGAAAARVHSTC